ncbi:MAG: dicarboxylate/amino acid:cation symporter [Kangiellaceae bacterium]|nr:dicarboxylate/amino acid:cation symporter [Kangiellaceae bacterium]
MESGKRSLSFKIMVALVAGILVGLIYTFIPEDLKLFDQSVKSFLNDNLLQGIFLLAKTWFINSLKLIVVPLVLVSLICGTCSLSDPNKLGSMTLRAGGLYLFTTGIAVILGICFAILLEPGSGVSLSSHAKPNAEAVSVFDMFSNLITQNPFYSISELRPNMLQIIIFAILFGLAISLSGEKGKPVATLFESMNEVIMKLVTLIMKVAPYGIFCIMAIVVSEAEWQKLMSLIKYFLLVIVVLIFHALVVYPALLKIIANINPIAFLKKFKPVMLFAFSSSSSSATLPVTLEVSEKRIGVGNSTASFVLPLGSTINMDGTAILQGIATVFVAQQYGIDLTFGQYLTVILTATMASIGAAGVPSAGIVLLVGVLGSVGLPTESIAMILGIDRILDMVRTVVNVTGDATVATIVSKWEGNFSDKTFNDPDAGLQYEAEKLKHS